MLTVESAHTKIKINQQINMENRQPNFESIEDSFIDCMGYSIIGLLLLRNQWRESLFTDDTPVQEILSNLNDIFNNKMRDYGLADMETGGVEAVLSRMTDKLARLKNLTGIKPPKPVTDLVMQFTQKGDYPIAEPAYPGDAGRDIYVAEDKVIPAGLDMPIDVPALISVKLPEGTFGLIINRSSTARKYGLDVLINVIDSNFTGELYALVWNRTSSDIKVTKGMRLAQLLVLPYYMPVAQKVDVLPKTVRHTKGFGSSGK